MSYDDRDRDSSRIQELEDELQNAGEVRKERDILRVEVEALREEVARLQTKLDIAGQVEAVAKAFYDLTVKERDLERLIVDRMLIVLWEIRMTAERANINDSPWALPNQIKHLAEAGMGSRRARAQELSAEAARRRG